MFLKQYNYKPRTGSTGSQDAAAASQATANVNTNTNANEQQGSVTAATAGRRRSSAEKFAGLQGYKRGSTDANAFAEQSQQSGVLGQMWNNFTKGTK